MNKYIIPLLLGLFLVTYIYLNSEIEAEKVRSKESYERYNRIILENNRIDSLQIIQLRKQSDSIKTLLSAVKTKENAIKKEKQNEINKIHTFTMPMRQHILDSISNFAHR